MFYDCADITHQWALYVLVSTVEHRIIIADVYV